ncbi:hypothetical protein PRIPAC_77259 [Pristionchus pacificus]|nr:hypothetical protein PRIPAC_77259 [Pristionchus pacificus]
MAVQIRFITEAFAAPEYNCSAHTPEEWTVLFGKPQLLLGIFSIVFSTACQILYLPALRVFYRERRMTCYKFMLVVALADMGGLACFGTLFGVTMLRGTVFCSDPVLAWIVGSGEGKTSAFCILFTILYGLAESLFTRPPLPNSTEQFCAFNPFIPGHTPDEYPNRPNMYHDVFLALCLPALFVVMFGIVTAKTGQLIQDASRSTSVQRLQAKIFTQASFVCLFFGASSSVWVFQEFLFVPPPSVLIAGMVMCQAVHGLPCVIYLMLNDAVRKEALRMIGRKPAVKISSKVVGAIITKIASRRHYRQGLCGDRRQETEISVNRNCTT